MPQGKGTYGNKVGRPPKKMMGGGMMHKKIKGYKAGGSVFRVNIQCKHKRLNSKVYSNG